MSRLERLGEELREIRQVKQGTIWKARKLPYTSLERENERFLGLRERISDLLQRINSEALNGKGQLTGWRETMTPEHSHRMRTGPHLHEWSHSSRQMEIRLVIPDIKGELVVFAPLHGREEFGFATKSFYVLSVGPRDGKRKGKILCDQKGKKIPLGYTDDEIIERATQFLSKECLRIHKAAFSLILRSNR